MDGPAAAPELEMRLGVDSCTLGPFPVPRLGGGAGAGRGGAHRAARCVDVRDAAGGGGELLRLGAPLDAPQERR